MPPIPSAVRLAAFSLCILLMSVLAQAAPPASFAPSAPSETGAPEALFPWKDWVLHGHEVEACPPLGENPSQRVCLFPQKLVLRLEEGGASFELEATVLAETPLALPYAKTAWPSLDAGPEGAAPVADKGGVPTVYLAPGEHRLTGTLSWKSRPESLFVSPLTGLLEVYRNGVPDPAPGLSPEGELRLSGQGEKTAKTPENAQNVSVFRLFTDGIPAVITTAVRLEVSGMARRIQLPGLLPRDSKPQAVRSPLPLAFGPEGTLVVQAGPGSYLLEVDSRLPGPVDKIGPMDCPFGPEIWSFAAKRDLRETEPGGLPGVDPSTTRMPQAWTGYPAYLAEKGATLTFATLRRGVETGKNELFIERELWLDFDGKGLSVRDRITGDMREGWTLSMAPPGEPGRVAVQGRDQPIVLLGDPPLPGVEIRDSRLEVMAESRYESFGGAFPAAGWNRDMGGASATLRLPPGWRLFAATGADAADGSWVGRWNLLNIFLTLVISLAAFKLCGKGAGLALFAFLLLSYHEADAPVSVWIVYLVFLALAAITRDAVKAKKGGLFRRLIMGLYALSAVALAVSCAVFVVTGLRYAIYPQLEPVPPVPYDSGFAASPAVAPPPAPMRAKAQAMRDAPVNQAQEDMAVMEMQAAPEAPAGGARPMVKTMGKESGESRLDYDPYALVQTGPGMPDWSWRAARLTWNGPVSSAEAVRLYLVSPGLNLALAALRMILLGLALWLTASPRRFRGVGGEIFPDGPSGPAAADKANEADKTGRAGKAGAAILLVLALMGAGVCRAADFPPNELLDQFRSRLLEPAACFPDCLAMSEASVRLDGGRLVFELNIDAAATAAVSLPEVSGRWRPLSVRLDGRPAALAGKGGGLLLLTPKGVHRAILSGPVPEGGAFDLSFPLSPKRVRVDAPGWSVQGLSEDGVPGGALRFARTGAKGEDLPRETFTIDPFFEVARTFDLGLTWEIGAAVSRLTPADSPAVVEIPLLSGESVVTDGIVVREGRAVVSFAPGQKTVSWRSRLEITPKIELSAPKDVPFVERWTISAAPIWSVAADGLPAVRLLDGSGGWRPEFRPWPGEGLVISAVRPKAAPGPSMTIDRVSREIVQGERLREETLTLDYRASMGGRSGAVPPPGAEIQDVRVDGAVIPYGGGESGEISFPVSPGAHTVTARWRLAEDAGTGLTAGPASLKAPAVNVETRIRPPKDRWILFVHGDGPMAPAVLFWSYLAAVAVVAAGLGRLPFSPLKSWQWVLLGLGLTQVDAYSAFLAVVWLLALGIRRGNYPEKGWFGFDLAQILLVLLVLVGLSGLYEAIQTGLLGEPRMMIGGNGSSASELVWTADRIAGQLPEPGLVSVPMYVYRAVMLVWSLWLAWSLLGWLKWGYAAFGEGGFWRKPVFAPRTPRFRFKEKAPAAGATHGPSDPSGPIGPSDPGLASESGEGSGGKTDS